VKEIGASDVIGTFGSMFVESFRLESSQVISSGIRYSGVDDLDTSHDQFVVEIKQSINM